MIELLRLNSDLGPLFAADLQFLHYLVRTCNFFTIICCGPVGLSYLPRICCHYLLRICSSYIIWCGHVGLIIICRGLVTFLPLFAADLQVLIICRGSVAIICCESLALTILCCGTIPFDCKNVICFILSKFVLIRKCTEPKIISTCECFCLFVRMKSY